MNSPPPISKPPVSYPLPTKATIMEVEQVLYMNGGEGETSYAANSFLQRRILYRTRPFIEEAIQQLCSAGPIMPRTMGIADLGCSTGPNSLLPLTMILDTVHGCCLRLGCSSPEFHVSLNDLPGNDFNTIFRTIPSFTKKLQADKGDEFAPCYIAATPGSFHGRLFPSQSLHFVYSANSLHWLSQTPRGLREGHRELNRGNISLGKGSPPCAFEAYLTQFKRDFTTFLVSRSVEVVPGGHMVISLAGRKTTFVNEEHHGWWDDIARILRDLVKQEEKVDSFNLPYYEPHIKEIRDIIQEQGSFDIIQLSELGPDRLGETTPEIINPNILVNIVRAIMESLLTSHFGSEIVEELFKKYSEKLMQGRKYDYVALTGSLIRKK